MGKLIDKVAVITGGNSGIGLATAQRFIAEGASVVITGRRQAAVEEALELLGPKATGFCGDVSNMRDLDALYAQVKERFGRIDVLVANAGIVSLAPFEQVTEAQFDEQNGINVKGVFFTVQKALPLLVDGASVILVSSIAHLKGWDGHSVYAASKASVRSFARSWALDLKARQIRVNCLSPGPVSTPIIGKMGVTEDAFPEFEKNVSALIPLGRFGQPQELASAALFLASQESSFITGIDLCVDGGIAQI